MLALTVNAALATTLDVGAGQPYGTIGSAVAAATGGDVVVIHSGTYVEAISLTTVLSFVGAGDPVWQSPAGAIALVSDVSVQLEGITFDGDGGDCVRVEPQRYGPNADVRVTASTFTRCANGLQAGNGQIIVEDSRFVDNVYPLYLLDGYASGIFVRRNVVEDNDTLGGMEGWVVLEDNVFQGATVEGLALAVEHGSLLRGNVFCGNEVGSATVQVYPEGGGAMPTNVVAFVDNLFSDNHARGPFGAGALVLAGALFEPYPWVLQNNTFVGNSGRQADHVLQQSQEAVLVNNVFAGGSGRRAAYLIGPGLYFNDSPNVRGNWNLFFANGIDLRGAPRADLGPDTLFGVDPMVTSYTPDGDCTNDDLTPLPGSPLIDGGSPALVDEDGTRSDIGYRGY